MRHTRRKSQLGHEFGGSGEDSFVAVVVTKLTGALLFILLLTMVIMALIPKAVDMPDALAHGDGAEQDSSEPLQIITPAVLPEAIVGRPYVLALAATGGSGPLSWSLEGPLPDGLKFDPSSGRIEGTPKAGTPAPATLTLAVKDRSTQVLQTTQLLVYRADSPLTLPSWLNPRLPVIPWRSWLEQGFGFLTLALMHLLGMNGLARLQQQATLRTENAEPAKERVSRRFGLYRASVRLASLSASIALGFLLWRGEL